MNLKKYTSILLAGLFLFSCQETETPATENGREVSLTFPVESVDMQQVGDKPATRAEKVPGETKINSLYLVQFNGNAPGSTVVKSGVVERDVNDHTTTFDFSAVNAVCRVYVIANFNPNAANGTTLANFEKSIATYAAATSVDASGLPMCDYKDFNPTTVSQAPKFAMTAMVAKLTVTYTVDAGALADFKAGTTETSLDVVLKNVPNGTAYLPTTTPDVAYRPTNVTFSDLVAGKTGATYTYYVPENIAGKSSANITDWKKRSAKNAPANALYFEVSGRNVTDKGTILIASFIGDPAKPNEFNIYRNTAYTLTATITNGKTGSADERITVKPDYFNLNTEGTSKGYANCYIIADNESKDYGFDATKRGNGVESGTDLSGIKYSTLPVMSTATSAKVIWQTGGTTAVVKSVRLEDGKVIFTTGTATEGNAVIGIFDSSNLCVWSWHIWKLNGTAPGTVTASKTSATTGGTVNVTMMDRNLGAYNNTANNVGSIGLLYQWGRKDPFPGPGVFGNTEPTNIYGSWNNGSSTGSWSGAYSVKTAATNATIGTEAWAVKYPTAFILQTSSPYDWMVTKNDYLWGTPWEAGGTGSYNKNQGTKSIYDPCPIGYRVPPQDTWSKQTGNGSFSNNGIILGSFHASLWFPAAGLRNGISVGELANSPGYGYYWSSSPHGGNPERGGNLYFNSSGGVNPQGNGNRVNGFSVRCVSEL